jgi:exodeoxyribonuclease V beta subunit
VRSELGRQGFDAETWTVPVTEALADMFATPLTADSAFTLGAIPKSRRLSELEFTFPAAGAHGRKSGRVVTPTGLARVFTAREGHGIPAGYGERVASLGFAPLTGFLRGFIDLVFEYDGRFYVADYKSNHLGVGPSAYGEKALVESMAQHHYFLQSHLYLVALHRFLGTRLPNYDYERHVGGSVYLFLRGMSPARGASTGVFFDLPPKSTILELSALLDTGEARRRAS